MKNLSSIFRILILTAGALWLTRIHTIHAQGIGPCYGSTCIKQFDTEFGSACYDCCSSQPLANDIIDGVIDASQGLYSPQNNTMDCGNANACVGVSCGTQTYCTAVLDATCCLPAGTPCNQGTCCSGLICLSNNTCGACIGGGGACGANSDCCSSICCNGTCTNNICSCPDTALCDDYTTFATDYCMYPQGGCPAGYYASNYCCYNGTPIVIDAFKEGFHLTSEIAGVNFHIHQNGPLYRVSWTDPQWHNGWLALDRNGNGTIDDFTELFGNLTPQPPSRTPNGYAALAVFDDPANGGNGNGVIDPGDSVYDKLRVWIDANHNGFSEPNELHTLRELDIRCIGLTYTLSQYVDANGNQFRYRAHIWDEAGAAHNVCYDVILQVLPLNN